MRIYIISKDKKPEIQTTEVVGNAVNLRIVNQEKKYDYFIGDDGKLKKIRNKKTVGLIDILIESMKK
jgi:hypothetical protein